MESESTKLVTTYTPYPIKILRSLYTPITTRKAKPLEAGKRYSIDVIQRLRTTYKNMTLDDQIYAYKAYLCSEIANVLPKVIFECKDEELIYWRQHFITNHVKIATITDVNSTVTVTDTNGDKKITLSDLNDEDIIAIVNSINESIHKIDLTLCGHVAVEQLLELISREMKKPKCIELGPCLICVNYQEDDVLQVELTNMGNPETRGELPFVKYGSISGKIINNAPGIAHSIAKMKNKSLKNIYVPKMFESNCELYNDPSFWVLVLLEPVVKRDVFLLFCNLKPIVSLYEIYNILSSALPHEFVPSLIHFFQRVLNTSGHEFNDSIYAHLKNIGSNN